MLAACGTAYEAPRDASAEPPAVDAAPCATATAPVTIEGPFVVLWLARTADDDARVLLRRGGSGAPELELVSIVRGAAAPAWRVAIRGPRPDRATLPDWELEPSPPPAMTVLADATTLVVWRECYDSGADFDPCIRERTLVRAISPDGVAGVAHEIASTDATSTFGVESVARPISLESNAFVLVADTDGVPVLVRLASDGTEVDRHPTGLSAPRAGRPAMALARSGMALAGIYGERDVLGVSGATIYVELALDGTVQRWEPTEPATYVVTCSDADRSNRIAYATRGPDIRVVERGVGDAVTPAMMAFTAASITACGWDGLNLWLLTTDDTTPMSQTELVAINPPSEPPHVLQVWSDAATFVMGNAPGSFIAATWYEAAASADPTSVDVAWWDCAE